MTYAVAMLNIDGTYRRRNLHTKFDDLDSVWKLAVTKFGIEPDEISVSCTVEVVYKQRSA